MDRESPAPKSTGHASAEGASPPRLSISPKQARRAQSLARLMQVIDRAVARGETKLGAVRRVSRRQRGRSAQTLRTHYYHWLKAGRNDDVLHANYACGPGLEWTAARRQRFMEALPTATSFADLHGKLFKGAKGAPGYTQFHRSFPAAERQALCTHFAGQRRAYYTARRFAKWLRRPERSFAGTGGAT